MKMKKEFDNQQRLDYEKGRKDVAKEIVAMAVDCVIGYGRKGVFISGEDYKVIEDIANGKE